MLINWCSTSDVVTDSGAHFRFGGTLFRFPLRTEEHAAESDICKVVYSHQKAVELIQSFRDEAEASLLFLRNVERVELYTWDDGVRRPVL